MSIKENEIVEPEFGPTFRTIDRNIATLDLDAFSSDDDGTFAMADAEPTSEDRLQRVLSVYLGVRTLLTALATLPIFPQRWRKALRIFVEQFDLFAASASNDDFKAGKDL